MRVEVHHQRVGYPGHYPTSQYILALVNPLNTGNQEELYIVCPNTVFFTSITLSERDGDLVQVTKKEFPHTEENWREKGEPLGQKIYNLISRLIPISQVRRLCYETKLVEDKDLKIQIEALFENMRTLEIHSTPTLTGPK